MTNTTDTTPIGLLTGKVVLITGASMELADRRRRRQHGTTGPGQRLARAAGWTPRRGGGG